MDTSNKTQEQAGTKSSASFIAIYSTRSVLLNRESFDPVVGRKETWVALGIHRAAITAPAYLWLGSPRPRVNLYMSTIYRETGKGLYGIASHQGTPCGSSIYRLCGRSARLVMLATLLFFSPLWRGVSHISQDRIEANGNDEQWQGNVPIIETITILKFEWYRNISTEFW